MEIFTMYPLLPETGFIRLANILRIIPIGKTTWWAGVKSGRFPEAIKLGERTTAWRVEDIRELIESRNQQSAKISSRKQGK
jgi:predicted DNA-binding transcriptional regulator AlpA